MSKNNGVRINKNKIDIVGMTKNPTCSLEIKEDPKDAPKYEKDFCAVALTKAIIVKNGAEKGNATVDLQLIDENGKKYVAMVTGNILRSISAAAATN